MKKIIIFVLIVSLIPLFGWLFRAQVLNLYLEKQKNEAREAYFQQSPENEILKAKEKMSDDINILSKHPIFISQGPGTSDASTFLNPKVSWVIGNEIKPGLLHLPANVLELLSTEKDFNQLSIVWENWNLDFSFFQTIHQFDVWSFDNEKPFSQNETHFKMGEIPQVNYTELMNWSKLRLLHGRDHNDLNQAINDVSHLAKLVMSSETSVGAMASLSLLRIVANIAKTPEVTSETIPLESIDAAKRFFWAQENLTDLRLGAETFALYAENAVGLCPRVNEALSAVISYRRLITNELKENFNRLNSLESKTRPLCRMSYIRKAWSNNNYQGFFDETKNINESVPSFFGPPGVFSDLVTGLFPQTLKEVEAHPQMAPALGFLLLSLNSLDKMTVYK